MTEDRPGPVVIGVDGTPGCEGALRYGTAEALRLGTRVLLVHVVPGFVPVAALMPLTPDELTDIGARILARSEQTARQLAPEVEVEPRLRHGARSVELARIAHDAPLLVVGRTEHSLVERAFAGDTGTAVAARSSVPCVSVPGDWKRQEVDVVLVGIKSRVDADVLLDHAFALAVVHGARVRALHAWRLASEYDDIIAGHTRAEEWTERSLRELTTLLQPCRERFPDVDVETVAVHDQPAHALAKASRDADLLVLLRRPRDIPALRHLGATGRALLHGAVCPVVVVPPETAHRH